MFILIKWPCWLLSVVWKSGSYKRAGWQVRPAIRNKANRRMEMAKMLMFCVCLTSVFLHCAEVRLVPFIFWYRHERLHEFFFFSVFSRSQIRQIVHLNTSQGIGKFRKMPGLILCIELFGTGKLRIYILYVYIMKTILKKCIQRSNLLIFYE